MVRSHRELEVYQKAFESAMKIFEYTKKFPLEEKYSLTDQMRRSSRSVCSNLAEAWRKRRYEGAFISKMNDAEGEAGETQTWIEFSFQCGYLSKEQANALFHSYDEILGMLVNIITKPKPWLLLKRAKD